MEWANLLLLLQLKEIKVICSTSSVWLCSFNPGGLILFLPAIHTFFFQQLLQQSRPGCSTFGSIEGLDCLFSGFISLLCLRAFPSLPVSLTSWSKTPCEVQSFHPGIFFNPLSSLQCRDWNVDSHLFQSGDLEGRGGLSACCDRLGGIRKLVLES